MAADRLYSGKLLRVKTFTNFAVLEPPAKVFSMKYGHFLSIQESFLPRKFPAIQYTCGLHCVKLIKAALE